MSAPGVSISIHVNGETHSISVQPHHTLLQVLRYDLGLTGSKKCCGEGECGACTVILDGRAVNSCLMLAAEADGSNIVTVEGLERDGQLSAVQRAFLDRGGVQCGFCTPGMIMAAEYLLMNNPHPSEEEIREGLSGNLCRCTGYQGIVEAVQEAAGEKQS